MIHKIYNIITYFWHQILKRPYYLKKGSDRKVQKTKLTVIFLHGIAADSSTWNSTIKNFSKNPDLNNVRLLTLDLLGFGKSLKADWLNYDYNNYNQALANTVKHYRIKTPIIVVGHSMGSLIAAEYSLKNPGKITELILVSPPVLMNKELAKLPDKFYLKSYGSIHKISKEPAIQALANFIQKVSSFRADYLHTVAFSKSMDNIILNPKNFDFFTKIKTKTHIIHGRLDALVMRPNLVKATKENPNLKLTQVISHHDISVNKRDKILISIKKYLDHETI